MREPIPASARACRLLAEQRRRAGLYDRHTLACHRRAWLLSGNASDLLAYLHFRRDLGYPLTAHGRDALLERLPRLSPKGWLMALNLLAESGTPLPDPARIPWLTRRILLGEWYPSPPLADWLRGLGRRPGSLASTLARVQREQETWRRQFAREARAGGICVVGNGGDLKGGGLGGWIDEHALVIRFNQYMAADSDPRDVGRRLDVWARAPGFRPHGLTFSGRWLLATGPDVRYRLTNWRLWTLDRPLLTTPLPLWRALVGRLGAPPTAGLLVLAWLRDILGDLRGVDVAGFTGLTGDAPYHHALPGHAAAERHRWEAERALLKDWIATPDAAKCAAQHVDMGRGLSQV